MVAVTPIIALWAAPRSRSTAFLRMIIERGDLVVIHEPFSNLAAVGRFEIDGVSATTESQLLDLLLRHAGTTGRRVFIKETTDYRYDAVLADPRFYALVTNTFMIRDPAAVVASHYAMNPSVQRDDIGFERLHEMFQAVRAATGMIPAVMDGDDLVADPPGVIAGFCARVGLDFRPAALTWKPTERSEWDRTRDWHVDVARSSGFSAPTKRYAVRPDNDPRLAALVDYHWPFHQAMYQHRLMPTLVSVDRPATG